MAKNTAVELTIQGPGEFTVVAIDGQGRLLMRKRVVLSGDPKIHGKSQFPLVLQTVEGEVQVVPLLVHQSNRRQKIAFDGRDPSEFAERRGRGLKIARPMLASIARQARFAPLAGREGAALPDRP